AMKKKGLPVIASLPEYWKYHWPEGILKWIGAGVSGFEIVNSVPKALAFPRVGRRRVADLCRQNGLFMTGVSDNHGYGYATAAWSAMHLPGWQAMDPDSLETVVLKSLKAGRTDSVQVLKREAHLWRIMQPWQAISWVGWIWFITISNRIYARK